MLIACPPTCILRSGKVLIHLTWYRIRCILLRSACSDLYHLVKSDLDALTAAALTSSTHLPFNGRAGLLQFLWCRSGEACELLFIRFVLRHFSAFVLAKVYGFSLASAFNVGLIIQHVCQRLFLSQAHWWCRRVKILFFFITFAWHFQGNILEAAQSSDFLSLLFSPLNYV